MIAQKHIETFIYPPLVQHKDTMEYFMLCLVMKYPSIELHCMTVTRIMYRFLLPMNSFCFLYTYMFSRIEVQWMNSNLRLIRWFLKANL